MGLGSKLFLLHALSVISAALLALPGAYAADITEESVMIQTFDGISLSGRLAIPDSNPKAVVVIISGSGNVAADGDVSSPLLGWGYKGAPAKLSEQIATKLASAGIASIRYSKRGVEDPAQLPNQTVPFLIKDAKSAMNFVRSRFPTAKLGLVGFSEGALLSVIIAGEEKVDALFLPGPATRPLDEILSYQFKQWPTELLARKLDTNHDGEISALELSVLGENGKFPLLGLELLGALPATIDTNKDGAISVKNELIPAYESQYQYVLVIAMSPAFKNWYLSHKDLSPFAEYAKKVTAPIYFYQASDDAQLNAKWIEADRSLFTVKTELQTFKNLGHCFSPMDGVIGEIKTSGPFSESLLEKLAQDVQKSPLLSSESQKIN